jgi:hypothetical protein
MTERPILFSAPMVRAILAGSKTQTRRVISNPHRNDEGFVLQDYGKGWWPYRSHDGESACYLDRQKDGDYYSEAPLRCPYGRPGDRLWVRETWARDDEDGALMYRADLGLGGDADEWERNRCEGAPRYRWRPSIHMPRRASRITLEITSVRAQRLQDISNTDAIAEGIEPMDGPHGERWRHYILPGYCDAWEFPKNSFGSLWELVNGEGSWDDNPWVWALSFRRVDA